jgi:hypothetical protein
MVCLTWAGTKRKVPTAIALGSGLVERFAEGHFEFGGDHGDLGTRAS